MASVLKATRAILVGAGFTAAAACLGLLAGQPFGVHSYTVLTGSMAPALPVGSLVVTATVPGASVRPGDVITFEVPGRPGMLVTHRVHSLVDVQGVPFFVTKGDANGVTDGWRIPATPPRSRMIADLPLAGLLTTVPARVVIFGIPLLVLLRPAPKASPSGMPAGRVAA